MHKRLLLLFAALALPPLLAPAPAAAQSFTRGVSQSWCQSQGGRFTFTGRVGADVGECLLPGNNTGGIPGAGAFVPRGGGRAAAGLGAAAGALGAAAGILSMMDSMEPGMGSGGGGRVYPRTGSNDAALTPVSLGLAAVPNPGDALNQLVNDPAAMQGGFIRTYYMGGRLSRDTFMARVAERCAGSTQVAQMVCVQAEIVKLLMVFQPGAREECEDKVEPLQGICAARVYMQSLGIQAGECVGDCTVRMMLQYDNEAERERRALSRQEEAEQRRQPQ